VNLLPQIENIAREAGVAILAVYACDFMVEHKADQSPLTEADKAANRIITNTLSQLTPDIPILSEEAVEHFDSPNPQGQYWLVDPLDGTKEFIKKNGEFTVNIALIENGKPILGVVYAPALDLLYAAEKGQGAFKVDERGQRSRLQAVVHKPGTPWKVVGSRSHADASLTAWLAQLDDYELVPMGSSLKFCLVAEGRADIYPRLGPTSLWDTAAGQCVVEQAGGQVVQINGQPLGYADTTHRLNPHFIVESVVEQ
jgi:3'(2'), 5'-bisphosphate nucleotidase